MRQATACLANIVWQPQLPGPVVVAASIALRKPYVVHIIKLCAAQPCDLLSGVLSKLQGLILRRGPNAGSNC